MGEHLNSVSGQTERQALFIHFKSGFHIFFIQRGRVAGTDGIRAQKNEPFSLWQGYQLNFSFARAIYLFIYFWGEFFDHFFVVPHVHEAIG